MVDVWKYPSPEAEQATVIYAVADIHGRLDLLLEMERLIADDLRNSSPRKPVICYLGDYIDRGPQSAQVIAYLSSDHADGLTRVFLRGNHEDRMLAFMQDPAVAGPAWMKFGGQDAFVSYQVTVPDELDEKGWLRLRDALVNAVPPQHIAFLEASRLAFRWQGYLFVHAGLNPDRPLDDQEAHDLMWIREPFLNAETDWGLHVVHGHVIVPEPAFRTNRTGIDTGAHKSGRLTCLVVSADGARVLQTRGP